MAKCTLLSLAALLVHAEPSELQLKSRSSSRLEDQIAAIDSELTQLANYSPRSGIGAIGYRSKYQSDSNCKQWVEIDLCPGYVIDEVVIVPAIWRHPTGGFQSDGFPESFRVVVGTGSNRTGRVVAEYASTAALLPRIAPLIIPIAAIRAEWLRIEADRLSVRSFDNRYVFQFSEIMVFSGSENIALRKAVKALTNAKDLAGAWDKEHLVDGFTPYLMDSAQGYQSLAYVSMAGEKPALTLDLEGEYPLSRIHLHAIDQSATVPQAYAGDLGIPRNLLVEGATQPDFSDAVRLLQYRQENINDAGPIMMWNIPETTCRYVRISEIDDKDSAEIEPARFRIGFAEIELFSEGKNVALGKPVIGIYSDTRDARNPAALTDGHNLYGRILPTRIWMEELARRHELESLRPILASELTRRYALQRTNLNRLTWIVVLLTAGIAFTILIERLIRHREISRIRDRFAADLHDELGANIHTIGLLGDLAKEAVNSPDELIELLDRTRVFTERSGAAVRYCINTLEAENLCADLVEEMKRSSDRLLADLKHTITFEGEQLLNQLKPRKRIDLFFFYKESLTNIIRHSGATEVTTRLTAAPDLITLSITDNGHGLADLPNGSGVPASLKRRARLLRAQVTAESPAEGGTRITLKLRMRRWRA